MGRMDGDGGRLVGWSIEAKLALNEKKKHLPHLPLASIFQRFGASPA